MIVAVVPLKAIGASKTRMAPTLSPADRELLLRRTLAQVSAACRTARAVTRMLVVAGDDLGAAWAREEGAEVLLQPVGAHGLNGALASADELLGETASLVVPADLPLVSGEDLDAVADRLPAGGGVVVAPTADGGTGALLRSPGAVIPPAFGPGSADRHLRLAEKTGVPAVRAHLPGLALDLDQPGDIARAGGWTVLTGGDGEPAGAG